MISLDFYDAPISQSRPRVFHSGRGVRAFNPQAAAKLAHQWQIKSQYRDAPIAGPVAVEMTFFMPIPASTSKIRRRQMLNGVCYHIKKPDIDNLIKFYFDCLCKLVIDDDCQIVELKVKKIYSEKHGTNVRIRALNDFANERNDESFTRNG